MIQKINVINNHSYRNTFCSNPVSVSKVLPTQSEVRDNFTFKTSTDGLKSSETIKGSINIEGKTYGTLYKLQRISSLNVTELNGYIGDKKVSIQSTRQGILDPKRHITGNVGNKNVEIEVTTRFGAKVIKGKFGEENIDFGIQSYRYNDIISGKGVDMRLMYYADSNPKYLGKYELDKEFLPILAGLSRYK